MYIRGMRKIHFADHLEKRIAEALHGAGIDFVHESENKEQSLDFYLPFYDVYIEVKQFHADRISRQMESKGNVIAIQGANAVDLFVKMILSDNGNV
jgi:hypothetical protein